MASSKVYQSRKIEQRFFYGYVVVVLSFLIMMVAFGMQDSFGVFFKPLLTAFGWTRATLSSAYSLSFLLFGALGIVSGGLTDRFGPRVVLTFCGFFLGLGYLLMSQLGSVWQLYLFQGIIIGIGISGLYAPILSLIARWFTARRGMMTGIVLAGMGIGQLLAPPVISRLISAYDWRMSYVILGSAVLVVIVLATQFLKRDPTRMGLLPYGENEAQYIPETEAEAYSLREALFTVQFWLIFVLKICFGFYMFSMVIHIVPHATDLGIAPTSAANILAVMGGAHVLGNFIQGRAGDRIGPRQVLLIGFVLASAALFWLLSARGTWMLYFFSVIIGFANGGNAASDSPLAARLFGLKAIGSIVGFTAFGFAIGAAVGPIATGYIFDVTGSYQQAFLVCAAGGVVGLVMVALLRPTKRLGIKI